MLRSILLAGLMSLGLLAAPTSSIAAEPTVGQPAPDFTLFVLNGKKVTAAELKGRVVIINFWAAWCVPCRKELPILDAYYSSHKDQGLSVYAVVDDDSDVNQLRTLFKVMAIPSVERIWGSAYRLRKHEVPTNIVIGRDGTVRYAAAGAFSEEGLDRLVLPLLKEPVRAAAN